MIEQTRQQPRSEQIVPKLVRELWEETQQTIGRTEAQIGEFISYLVEKGVVTHDEATKAFGDTFRRMRTNREEMADFMNNRLENICRTLRIPTRAEVEGLRQRVTDLRGRVDALGKEIK